MSESNSKNKYDFECLRDHMQSSCKRLFKHMLDNVIKEPSLKLQSLPSLVFCDWVKMFLINVLNPAADHSSFDVKITRLLI